MKIIYRYLIAEYLQQFFLCFLGCSVLSIGYFVFNMNDFFVGRRLPISLVIKLVGFRVPMLMLDVVPAAVIFGILLSLGRLVRERELDVLRTSGVSFFRLSAPILATTFLLSTAVFIWYDTVVPATNRVFQNQMRHLSYQDILPLITENVFIKGPDNRYFYVRRVDGAARRLEGVMVFETQYNGYPRIITADSGYIIGNNWELSRGIVHDLDKNGWVRYEVKFERMIVNAGNNIAGLLGRQLTIEEMTRAQLKQKMILLGKSGFSSASFAVEYYMKSAIPYAPFILAFITIPFTCMLSRSGMIWGLTVSFMLMLLYFFFQVVFRSLGQNMLVSPLVAAWGPNVIFFGLGLGLINRVKR